LHLYEWPTTNLLLSTFFGVLAENSWSEGQKMAFTVKMMTDHLQVMIATDTDTTIKSLILMLSKYKIKSRQLHCENCMCFMLLFYILQLYAFKKNL